MTDPWTLVRVDENQFCLVDSDQTPYDCPDFSTGLVIVLSRGAMILTGIYSGNVRVSAGALSLPPAELDPGPWEEIIEASVFSATGFLGVDQLYPSGASDSVTELPNLATQGPGWYRIRGHARGRDIAPDAIRVLNPVEHYLLQCWKTDWAPATLIRTTDHRGQTIRSAAGPPPSSPPQPSASAAPDTIADRLTPSPPVRSQPAPRPDQPAATSPQQDPIEIAAWENLRRRGRDRPAP